MSRHAPDVTPREPVLMRRTARVTWLTCSAITGAGFGLVAGVCILWELFGFCCSTEDPGIYAPLLGLGLPVVGLAGGWWGGWRYLLGRTASPGIAMWLLVAATPITIVMLVASQASIPSPW